jgi:putative restriction endonuclease
VRGYVAPTDHGWYQFLRARPDLDEVNFWRPGMVGFAALMPGEPFFFKLKAPHDAIGGFGLFARFALLPVWMAWDVFGQANGVPTEAALRERLTRLSNDPQSLLDPDRPIGCISIAAPVFFPPDEWIATPADWRRNIVSGRTYDLSGGEGRTLWESCLERAAAAAPASDWVAESLERERHGKPQLALPRRGQGTFRLAVLDAYGGACAVTTEHSLPAIDAAHIRPWAAGGTHEVANGLPLRRDLHRLFDLGYVTVRPDHCFAVSPRLRDEWANGRSITRSTDAPSRCRIARTSGRRTKRSSGTQTSSSAADAVTALRSATSPHGSTAPRSAGCQTAAASSRAPGGSAALPSPSAERAGQSREGHQAPPQMVPQGRP